LPENKTLDWEDGLGAEFIVEVLDILRTASAFDIHCKKAIASNLDAVMRLSRMMRHEKVCTFMVVDYNQCF
jgi:hypothetical protein